MLIQILATSFVVGFVAVVAYGHVLLVQAIFSGRDHGRAA